MKEILEYFRRPEYYKGTRINWSSLAKYLMLLLLISFPLNFISYLVQKLSNLDEVSIFSDRLHLFFIALIFAPVFEEIFCRILLKPRFKNIIVFSITTLFLGTLYGFSSQYELMAFMFMAGAFSGLLVTNKKILFTVQKFIIKRFYYCFYLSCIIFGFLHIFNYEPYGVKLLLLSPLIIAPSILAGMFLGLVRMKYGILFSILSHSIINLFALPSLLNQ